MKKNLFILAAIILLFGIGFGTYSQNYHTYFKIRDHKQSLILVTPDHNRFLTIIYSSYGQILNQSLHNKSVNRYFFKGQEYDENLSLFLFPSRTYSPVKKHFLQPDPKSQFYSPYLYVGADPINYIDFTGNAGKPLILYSQVHSEEKAIASHTKNLMREFGSNAHFVPMSKVINEPTIDLPDWNGRVFIQGHMQTAKGYELEIERSTNPSQFISKQSAEGVKVTSLESKPEMKLLTLDAKVMGKKIHQLGLDNHVNVQSIFAGGCHGSSAAEGISAGFAEKVSESSVTKGERLLSFGIKEGYETSLLGPFSNEGVANWVGPKDFQFIYVHEKTPIVPHRVDIKGTGKEQLLGYMQKDGPGKYSKTPKLNWKQFKNTLKGNATRDFRGVLDFYPVPY